jgi:hypothetical protein
LGGVSRGYTSRGPGGPPSDRNIDYDRRGIWDHGVTRAVDEFRASGAAETIRLRNHQFLLRKPL